MNINSRTIAYLSISASVILTLWFLIFGGILGGEIDSPDLEKIKTLQPFISGIAVPLITFGTSLLIIETYKNTTLQNISNNFFKLIDQNRKILDSLNIDISHLPSDDIKSKGKDFFDDLCDRIARDFEAVVNNDVEYLNKLDQTLRTKTENKQGKDLLVEIYDFYFHVYQSELGHYFRNLFYIVRYIEKCKIREVEKVEFIKILRSQLSNYEILLLAYNGLHHYGKEFYQYIEKYELLKSLNNESRLPETYTRRIIDNEILKQQYPHLTKYWI
ncbi:MAG: putative phage abortive infection protein [Arcicella sp.]|jgi:hypothetical protein|nr:putative phage abortive infection protein [Arcicella sp.]